MTSALDRVAQALTAYDPETLQAALAQLDAASTPGVYGNAWVRDLLRRDVLSGDPRLVVLEQRGRAAVAAAHPAAAAMWRDLLTAGLEPVLADRAQLAEPGGSAALTQQLRTKQAWDSAFLLLNLLGPLAEARTLLAGRRLPTAVVAQLRDANYTDAAIAHLERRLAPALAESAELRRLAYAGAPEDVLNVAESAALPNRTRVLATNLGDPADEVIRTAQNAISLPGYYDVIAHGRPDAIQLFVNDQNRWSSASDVAKHILLQPDYTFGTPVRLLCCEAGAVPARGGVPIAQEVADELAATVRAADAPIKPNADGTLELVEPVWNQQALQWDYHSKGEWLEFQPRSVIIKVIKDEQ